MIFCVHVFVRIKLISDFYWKKIRILPIIKDLLAAILEYNLNNHNIINT